MPKIHVKKKAFISILLLFAVFVALIFLIQPIAVSNSKIIISDGERINKSTAVITFLSSAFSNTILLGNSNDQNEKYIEKYLNSFDSSGSIHFNPQDIDKMPSWILNYLPRSQNKLPKSAAVMKWKTELTVGVGWPPDNDRCNLNNEKNCPHHNEENFYKLVKNNIELLSPQISLLSGLPIRLIDPNLETSENYARIRIIAAPAKLQDDLSKIEFPNVVGDRSLRPTPSTNDYESLIWGAVPFISNQVDSLHGYLLANSDNNLSMAICKIPAVTSDEQTAQYVYGCLVRSLGMPNFGHMQIEKGEKLFSRPLGALDKIIIRMLYCADIDAGMDMFEALSILAKNDKCFQSN